MKEYLKDIPIAKTGDTVFGITICEANRATVFEYRRAAIEQLCDIAKTFYNDKGVKAVVVGIDDGPERKFAVYVKDGFLSSDE